MSDPAFFGYGSLVNLATHDYASPRPAAVHGWRRVWRGTDLRPAAFLSVAPAPDSVLQGLIAQVPGADWALLDQRETGYRRYDVTDQLQQTDPVPPTAIYQIKPEHHADGAHPILLSYLDVVVQGYLRMYGHDGVAQFFATTDGWDREVLDDRDNPQYPRHQRLSAAETALVDDHLAKLRSP